MKFCKIVFALLLIMAITVTLFACGPQGDPSTDDPAGGETPGGQNPGGDDTGDDDDDDTGSTGGETGGEEDGDEEFTGTFKIHYQRTSAGKCVVSGFEGKGEGAIVIPETAVIGDETCTVVGIADRAFRKCKYITSIVVPNTVTSIGLGALEGCAALEELTVPFVGGAASSNTFIGYVFGAKTFTDNANYVPASLATVTVVGVAPTYSEGGEVTSEGATAIAPFAFDACTSIKTVNIGSEIKTIGAYAFARCSISVIDLPDTVTSVGVGAYVACPVTEAKVPFVGADKTGTVGHLGYIFGAAAYSQNEEFVPETLKKISVSSVCTTIGAGAFNDCTALEEINLPDTIVGIGENAFTNTPYFDAKPDGLVYVDRVLYTYKGEMGENTDIVVAPGTIAIAGGAFAGLPVTSLSIPESVISIGAGAFKGSQLSEIALPFVGENVEGTSNSFLGYIFGATKAEENAAFIPATLKSVSLFDTCITIAPHAFYGCDQLTKVEIGAGVESIAKNAFFACTSLADITVSADNAAYKNDSKLVYNTAGDDLIAVPMAITGDITLLNITEIADGQFAGCVGITSIRLPETLTMIGKEAFYGLNEMKTINFPDSLVGVGYRAFEGTGWFDAQPDGVVYTGNVLYKFKGEAGETIEIPSTVTGIAAGAFENRNLISVSIPSSVTNIGEGAFLNCQIESLTLPFIGADNSGENMPFLGYLFGATSSVVSVSYVPKTLKSVTLLDTCTRIGPGAFDGCPSVETLVIPDTVTYIAGEALNQTAWYKSQPAGLLYVGRIAYSFIAPVEENAPAVDGGETETPEEPETPAFSYDIVLRPDTIAIADKAFQMSKITSIRIPDTTTYIGAYAFSECSQLAKVRMSSAMEVIGEYAFFRCQSIESIYVPGTVNTISKNAFARCGKLATVTLGYGVQNVEEDAFTNCNGLRLAYYTGTTDDWLTINFADGNKMLRDRVPFTEWEYENEPFELEEEE